MQLIDGKQLSQDIQEEIRKEVEGLVAAGGRKPHLAAVLVGDNPASRTYVANKVKACERVGFQSSEYKLSAEISESELLKLVRELNDEEELDGILVQLPLPKHINAQKVIEAIQPEKDVDGFHPINIGRMAKNLPALLPATPAGILEMLRRYDIPTRGKHCVVVGNSAIVGSPMSILMARDSQPGRCTVTVCHSATVDLASHTRQADILIVAVGKAHLIKADMVKEGAVVIDVGINQIEDATKKSGKRMVGDVDFEAIAPKASFITPVPGGVGPMTIAALLKNTLAIYKNKS